MKEERKGWHCIKIFGLRFVLKDISKYPLLFTERYRYNCRKLLQIGNRTLFVKW